MEEVIIVPYTSIRSQVLVVGEVADLAHIQIFKITLVGGNGEYTKMKLEIVQ